MSNRPSRRCTRALHSQSSRSSSPTSTTQPPTCWPTTSAGYPTYSQARIDTAVTTYLVYLSIIGMLGVVCWLRTIRAVNAGKRWARGATTATFVLATGIALFDLLVKDTSGDTGLPALLGWIGMLPCLAGFLAVTLLWKRS